MKYYLSQCTNADLLSFSNAGGRIRCNIQRLSVFLTRSIHLSWDYLQLQDCVAGDCNHSCNHSCIQHQESQDQGLQRLEGDISYRLHYKHYFGICGCYNFGSERLHQCEWDYQQSVSFNNLYRGVGLHIHTEGELAIFSIYQYRAIGNQIVKVWDAIIQGVKGHDLQF